MNDSAASIDLTAASAAVVSHPAPEVAPQGEADGAVARIRTSIDIESSTAVLSFGDDAMRELGAYSDRILADVKGKDIGEAGALLSNLQEQIRSLDPESLQKQGFVARMLGTAQRAVERFVRRYEDVAGQINEVALKLEMWREAMRRDIAMLDDMHANGVQYVKNLDTYIAAGEQYVADFRQSRLPELQAALAGLSEDQLALQQERIQDLVRNIDRLERKVHDLKLARMVGLQRLPQIRIVQNGDALLMDKIHTAINTAIPAWKSQFVTALALERQKQAYETQQAVVDMTNELLRKNAEQLHQSATSIEQASQRSVIDIESVRQANELLLRTVGDVMEIQAEGRKNRAAVEVELKKLETDLRTSLARQAEAG
ncbi:toxic anion resistance protein [Burkholderia plantarii]|uniref:toxic anion resistance protein n=1 Tax=Burkholderia plantarii TaxID=41899 RepID=UPI0006981677|nr:toxic anion resistance protein [Burkholderia plantarii]ALK30000.1 putative toxic anion resistance protein [Burkholderia plantarii]WLE58747.1 toxic anion resistance protein [Burkholderia plantarii]GLZ21729.1 tellurite resistance protein [Burkholderia plantarii]